MDIINDENLDVKINQKKYIKYKKKYIKLIHENKLIHNNKSNKSNDNK